MGNKLNLSQETVSAFQVAVKRQTRHLCHLKLSQKQPPKTSRIPVHPYGISKCIVLGKRSLETNCSYGLVRP